MLAHLLLFIFPNLTQKEDHRMKAPKRPFFAVMPAVFALLLLLGLFAPCGAQNLLTNPGFEDGMNGWSGGGAFSAGSGFHGFPAHSGNFYAAFGYVWSVGTITQTLATTPGQQYQLSYYFGSHHLINS